MSIDAIAAAAVRRGAGPMSRTFRIGLLPPVVAAVVILGTWELVVRLFHIDSFLLPSPSDIASTFVDQFSVIASASYRTIQAVLLGLVLGVVFGWLMAVALSFVPRVSAPIMTFAIAVNSAPIIALAPISNNWFGITSIMSKAAIAAVMVFFPILVNTTRGLVSISKTSQDLMRSYAATNRETTRFIRIPSSLPYLFSALKLGSTLAVIGVIVTEYFGGPVDALGVYIANAAALSKFARAWAGVVAASVIGLTLFGITAALERVAMPWHASVREAPR